MGKIREFATGATRDTDDGKLDFEGFLSPLALRAYAEYMNKHRKQADGQMRDSDNWQKGFGEKHFDVCMKSLWRHMHDLWMYHRGFQGRESVEDALGGILFNTFAYLHMLEGGKEWGKKFEAIKHIEHGD